MLLSPLVPLVGVLVQGKLHLLSSLRLAMTRSWNWGLHAHKHIDTHVQVNLRGPVKLGSQKTAVSQMKRERMRGCVRVMLHLHHNHHWSTKHFIGVLHTPLKDWYHFESMRRLNSNNRLKALLSILYSHRQASSVDEKKREYEVALPSQHGENRVVYSHHRHKINPMQLSSVRLGCIILVILFCRPNHLPMCRLNHWSYVEAISSSKCSTKMNTTSRLLCKSNVSWEIIIDMGQERMKLIKRQCIKVSQLSISHVRATTPQLCCSLNESPSSHAWFMGL